VAGVLGQDLAEMPLAEDQDMIQALAAQRAHEPVPLQNVATWADLRVLVTRLRGSVVLVDHAAEHFAALHWRGPRHDDHLVMIGWALMPGLVWPVPVVATRGRTW
jgi:hypothetical protein